MRESVMTVPALVGDDAIRPDHEPTTEVPTPSSSPLASLRFVLRAARLLIHVAYGMLLGLLVKLDFGRKLRCERLAQHWSTRLMRILGITVRVRGQPMPGGGVIVANHVSWLDIPLLMACVPTRFVSKSEVQHWPVAGWLADASGTFYIRRGLHGSRPLLNRLLPHLKAGGTVTIFPEGTTTDGHDVLPLHPRLFAASIESQRPVQPVALRYGCGDRGEELAPFIGDDDLLSHLMRVLRNGHLDAEVVFDAPIEPLGQSREQLARLAQASIRSALGLLP
ncbi:MAG: lysophospholipid acyltransferase family protein [Panacagrimonas sp.]